MQQLQLTNQATIRRRQPPVERSAVSEVAIDPPAIAARLRQEDASIESRGGHHQLAVFRRWPVTMMVFAFDAGGTLSDHSANGLVTIHVYGGALTIRTPDNEFSLRAGMMLVLAPAIRHSVTAVEPSEMLLIVHLQPQPPSNAA